MRSISASGKHESALARHLVASGGRLRRSCDIFCPKGDPALGVTWKNTFEFVILRKRGH